MWKPIVSLALIVISVVFSVNYVVPEYGRIQKLKLDIVDLADISKDAEQINQLTSETEQILEGVDKDSDARFSRLIPETVDHLRFANNIKALALSRGIVLQELEVETEDLSKKKGPGEKTTLLGSIKNTLSLDRAALTSPGATETNDSVTETGKKYLTTKATLSFTTTYPAFLALLGDLEKSLEIINVTSLTFGPRKEAQTASISKRSGPQLYDYQVEVETYSIK